MRTLKAAGYADPEGGGSCRPAAVVRVRAHDTRRVQVPSSEVLLRATERNCEAAMPGGEHLEVNDRPAR